MEEIQTSQVSQHNNCHNKSKHGGSIEIIKLLNYFQTPIYSPGKPISFLLNPRQILIPDTSPCLFLKFLGYVYSGMVDMRSLSMDEVPEMLALSDKYEV